VASGYAVGDFVTGFPAGAPEGSPHGLAFDSADNLFVADYGTGHLYKFGPGGGVASAATRVTTTPIPGRPNGLAFGKDGRLYATLTTAGEVVEINPSTGAIVRVVAMGIPAPTGIATDPRSGDLFVSQWLQASNILRISHFAQGPGTVTVYAALSDACCSLDGLTFGPDGTLYTALEASGTVVEIAGTTSRTPGAVTPIPADVPSVDGVAVVSSPTGHAFLLANRNDGRITKIDLTTAPPTLTDIVTDGTRGDFLAVGTDGCVYATQSTSIVKVTNADGSCLASPTSPGPRLTLSPSVVPQVMVGTMQTFTAMLANAGSPAGAPVTFTITGANPRTEVTVANATRAATVTYAGTKPGVDTIVATARVGNAAVRSNPGTVTWGARATPQTPVPSATPQTSVPPATQQTPVVPATQQTPVVPGTTRRLVFLQCSVPLKTQAPRSLVGGSTLLVQAHTTSYARLTVSLKMLTQRVVVRGRGRHRKRIVHVIVQMLATGQGSANHAGTLVARLRLGYKPVRSLRALLTVTAHQACGAATRTAWVTLLPPRPAHTAKARR
jgi:hypothetical protein